MRRIFGDRFAAAHDQVGPIRKCMRRRRAWDRGAAQGRGGMLSPFCTAGRARPRSSQAATFL